MKDFSLVFCFASYAHTGLHVLFFSIVVLCLSQSFGLKELRIPFHIVVMVITNAKGLQLLYNTFGAFLVTVKHSEIAFGLFSSFQHTS